MERGNPPNTRLRLQRRLRGWSQDDVAAGLTLSWGVTPFVIPFDLINPENTIDGALKHLVARGKLKAGNTVVIIGSILVGEQIVDAVQMRVV